MRRRTLPIALGAAGLLFLSAAARSEEPPKTMDPGAAGVGKNLFKSYCVSCHGKTGLGDGSLAEHLRTPPADLTEISKREGSFPFELIYRIIDGRKPVSGHGSSDMPAWGDAFEKSSGGLTEQEVKKRIENLTHFLWSIQKAAG